MGPLTFKYDPNVAVQEGRDGVTNFGQSVERRQLTHSVNACRLANDGGVGWAS